MRERSQRPLIRIALVVIVASIAAIQTSAFVRMAPVELGKTGAIVDDAFFYSVLADNYLTKGFLSLDGEMPTNGIQPLWMAVQVGVGALFPATDSARRLLASSWLTWVALAASTTWLVARGRPLWMTARASVVAIVIVCNSHFQGLALRGLETPLVLLLLTWLLIALERWETFTIEETTPASSRSTRTWAAFLGLLAALVFLARTDLLWVVPLCGLLLLLGTPVHRRAHAVGAFLIASIGLVVPYLWHNWATQGSVMPVSGLVKLHYLSTFHQTWRDYLISPEWRASTVAVTQSLGLADLPFAWEIGIAAILLIGVQVVIFMWWLRQRSVPVFLRLASGLSVVHLAYMHLAYRELRPAAAYYFAPEMLVVGLCLAWGQSQWAARSGGRILERSDPVAIAGLVVALVVVLNGGLVVQRARVPYWEARIKLATEARGHIGGAERIGAFWPGVFAQFSHLRVTPLDGIVGSSDYLVHFLKPGREFEYLAERDIRYVIARFGRDGGAFLCSNRRPPIPNWSALGDLRLWEQRNHLREVARVEDGDGNGGWWILRIVDATDGKQAGCLQ